MKNFITLPMILFVISYALVCQFQVSLGENNSQELYQLLIGKSSLESYYSNFLAYGQEINTLNFTKGSGIEENMCGVLADSQDNRVYLTSVDGIFHILDAETNHEVNKTKTEFGSCAITFDSKDDQYFVINEFSNSTYIIDGSNYTTINRLEIKQPYEMVVNTNNDLLYITSDKNDQVFVVEKSGLVKKVIDITDPCGIAIDNLQNKIYVTSEDSAKVYVIDGLTNDVVATIGVDKGPRGIAVNEQNGKVYIANSLSNTVSVIDSKSNSVESTILVDQDPRKVALNSNANTLYLIGGKSNSLTFIDASSNKIKNSITIQNPYDISVKPDTNTVYVTTLSNSIFVIEDVDKSTTIMDNSFFILIFSVSIIIGIAIIVLLVQKKAHLRKGSSSYSLKT